MFNRNVTTTYIGDVLFKYYLNVCGYHDFCCIGDMLSRYYFHVDEHMCPDSHLPNLSHTVITHYGFQSIYIFTNRKTYVQMLSVFSELDLMHTVTNECAIST